MILLFMFSYPFSYSFVLLLVIFFTKTLKFPPFYYFLPHFTLNRIFIHLSHPINNVPNPNPLVYEEIILSQIDDMNLFININLPPDS